MIMVEFSRNKTLQRLFFVLRRYVGDFVFFKRTEITAKYILRATSLDSVVRRSFLQPCNLRRLRLSETVQMSKRP